MLRPDGDSPVCCFCGAVWVFAGPVVIGPLPRRVCRVCASAGAAVYKPGQAARREFACLHLAGCGIERCLEDAVHLHEVAVAAQRLKRRLGDGSLRSECGCSACQGRIALAFEIDRLPFEVEAAPIVFDESDQAAELRLVENRAVTAYPGLRPGGLAERAMARRVQSEDAVATAAAMEHWRRWASDPDYRLWIESGQEALP